MSGRERDAKFIEFAAANEPQLRRALVAAYGADRGSEAAAEALAYASGGTGEYGFELVSG